jgi:hypothetical protein
MRIIENQKPIEKLGLGMVVKGNVSGEHYLIVRQGSDRFNALNLKNNKLLTKHGYDSLESDFFLSSFKRDYHIKAHEITITLGGQQ